MTIIVTEVLPFTTLCYIMHHDVKQRHYTWPATLAVHLERDSCIVENLNTW